MFGNTKIKSEFKLPDLNIGQMLLLSQILFKAKLTQYTNTINMPMKLMGEREKPHI